MLLKQPVPLSTLRTIAVVFSECSWCIPRFGQWEVVVCALPAVEPTRLVSLLGPVSGRKIPEC